MKVAFGIVQLHWITIAQKNCIHKHIAFVRNVMKWLSTWSQLNFHEKCINWLYAKTCQQHFKCKNIHTQRERANELCKSTNPFVLFFVQVQFSPHVRIEKKKKIKSVRKPAYDWLKCIFCAFDTVDCEYQRRARMQEEKKKEQISILFIAQMTVFKIVQMYSWRHQIVYKNKSMQPRIVSEAVSWLRYGIVGKTHKFPAFQFNHCSLWHSKHIARAGKKPIEGKSVRERNKSIVYVQSQAPRTRWNCAYIERASKQCCSHSVYEFIASTSEAIVAVVVVVYIFSFCIRQYLFLCLNKSRCAHQPAFVPQAIYWMHVQILVLMKAHIVYKAQTDARCNFSS